MVTMNISMEADLANRTQGVINDIILDHREHLETSEIKNGNITLVYLQAMIVFQPLVLELQSPRSFRACFFCLHCLFSFCCLLSSAYCLSRSPAAFFVIHSHSTETFLFYYYYYIYTATYSRQHLRRCHPIECDTEVFRYIFST